MPSDTPGVHSESLLTAEDEAYSKGLKKRHIQMIAVGGAIGTGLFLGAGSRLNTAGPFLVVLYAIAGVFAFIVVRALGELVVYRPTSGSFVSYAREFMGEKGAYVSGWMYFLVWATFFFNDTATTEIYTASRYNAKACPAASVAAFAKNIQNISYEPASVMPPTNNIGRAVTQR